MDDTAALKIDTHVHFWDIEWSDFYWMTPELRPLQRTFRPVDLKPMLDDLDVDRVVIVQSARSDRDNQWWLQLADEHAYVGAVIGWVDLEAPDVGQRLDRFRGHPALRGVRATAENVADPGWLARPTVRRGVQAVAERGLVLDLLVQTPHLSHVPQLAEENPGLWLIVDHLAKPPLARGGLDRWQQGMTALVRYPRVVCKLSGLLTEAGPDPTAETIKPVVDFALHQFGSERLMWGSDWLVCTLVADYRATYETLTAALEPLSVEDRAALFGGNAARVYDIQ